MAKGKLILICQSGGEFTTNDDGSLSYIGGEANALDINFDTLFDDLKLKLSEMLNLQYESLSLKYFIPGNRRTLISLSNDKGLRRMYDFHGDLVTADLFVTGKAGFDREALNMHLNRALGVKLAETVSGAATAPTPIYSTATVAPSEILVSVPVSTSEDYVAAFSATNLSPTKMTTMSYQSPVYTVADTTPCCPTVIDMSCTPADTVKKRRRTASWKIGANGPTIVAVTDNIGEINKTSSRKRNYRNRNISAVAADDEQLHVILVTTANSRKRSNYAVAEGDSDPSSFNTSSSDVSPGNLVSSWKDGITGVGQDFKSVFEFRDVLQKYAIAHRFVYKLKKNDASRVSGICVVEGCSWRIHASWVPSAESFRIKKMNTSHTCGGDSWKYAHPAKSWLVSIIKERLQDCPHHKPKEIANGILQDFGIQLNYTQLWRAIEEAREQLQGSYKEAYNQLPWFCEKMVGANPGTIAKIFTGDDGMFQRLFISLHASRHGFQSGCRPLLFLDAKSLKSKYQEILLTATALDGDDASFPVAFAIVDIENNDNWLWFLKELRSAVSTSQSITFISDREKALEKFVLEVFENAHHGYSMYHLVENFKKNLKGPFHGDGKNYLPGSFIAAAHAIRPDGFRTCTEQIKRISLNAYDWVMQIEPEYWTNVAFTGERYNQITTDVGELYANWIEEVRELPIIQKVEVLRSKIMELIHNRQLDSSNWLSKLTPSKEEKLRVEALKSQGLKVLISSDILFEVHDDSINVVNINDRECSCLGWKGTGLPCCHAIAVLNFTGRNVYDYCSRYFTVTNFQSTYSESINPVLDIFKPSGKQEADVEPVHVLPPCTSRPRGQQKAKQTKSQEFRKTVFCTRCKGAGHNKATCKES